MHWEVLEQVSRVAGVIWSDNAMSWALKPFEIAEGIYHKTIYICQQHMYVLISS